MEEKYFNLPPQSIQLQLKVLMRLSFHALDDAGAAQLRSPPTNPDLQHQPAPEMPLFHQKLMPFLHRLQAPPPQPNLLLNTPFLKSLQKFPYSCTKTPSPPLCWDNTRIQQHVDSPPLSDHKGPAPHTHSIRHLHRQESSRASYKLHHL